MSLKNYYAILGVPRTASAEEIKKAFREGAKTHHPDKAPDNPFAAAHFAELQDAYEVLSHSSRRARYDEECWLRGLFQKSAPLRITPQWILGEAVRLRKHMATVDTYRMNHAALRDYAVALLSDHHLSILQNAPETHYPLLEALTIALRQLHPRYLGEVSARMSLLAAGNAELEEDLRAWLYERRREAFWDRLRPLIVLLFVALFMALMCWLRR